MPLAAAVDFNGTPFTSLLLLSTPFEMLADGEIDANCAAYDMNFGGPPGMIMDQTYFTYLVPGSTGAAYFRLLAWTGLYNTFDAAAAAVLMSPIRAYFRALRVLAELCRSRASTPACPP